MPIDKNEISKEMLAKALQCKTTDELIALAKAGGYEITEEDAYGRRCRSVSERIGRL